MDGRKKYSVVIASCQKIRQVKPSMVVGARLLSYTYCHFYAIICEDFSFMQRQTQTDSTPHVLCNTTHQPKTIGSDSLNFTTAHQRDIGSCTYIKVGHWQILWLPDNHLRNAQLCTHFRPPCSNNKQGQEKRLIVFFLFPNSYIITENLFLQRPCSLQF